jgi:(E)-4-hydroxy-3-methylbut-2-enyl-diphosphate synthase
MTNTDTRDVTTTVNQIHILERAGCEVIRVAVPDMTAASQLQKIKKEISIPLIADIHFNYRLALKAIEEGVDGLRINPGNIGEKNKIALIVKAAQNKSIPIRIGVNAGSLEKEILTQFKNATAEAMVESALRHIRFLESLNFKLIKVSLKASDVMTTIEAYRLMADKVGYPLHLGVTEAGTLFKGSIRSAIGIGTLLAEGIGDTIRVSLTADPQKEVEVGFEILKALGLRKKGPEMISCPTCGRCQIDLLALAAEVEEMLSNYDESFKVAVMGCAVNGPGEARQADIGVAGGKETGLIFRKGEVIKKVAQDNIVKALREEIEHFLQNNKNQRGG